MKTEVKVRDNKISTVLERSMQRGDETLDYYLYREEKFGRDSYSIQAVQYKRGIKICQATACDVSSGYEAAKAMFDTITDGYVEPYILCDVVYDLLP